ncbi:LacI family DNA-binding transcriptional regulator [Psychrobacillus sp. FSL K6-2684]|uniref:LacI family DNA-binding transcriptional regulator n=1 Tax=Psychrobacillus TaxID=1221880 RepID=UPI001CD9DE79|nr:MULTISPECIES: LacI family DNA-binding transcriptional regulator [Psychrobacillus]
MKQGITAKDVAKLAGVSQSSVSRVYFEGATVSQKTREKVLAAAKELGYRPNEFARSLITNRTKIIGLVMKGVQNPFYPQVLKQFTTAFKKLGYSILFVYTNNDEIQKDDIDTLLNYNVAGVIITDATLSLQANEDLFNNRIPLVLFNRKIVGNKFFSVCCNNLEASKQIAQYLLKTGCSNMIYISGNENTSTSKEREKGFVTVLEENKVKYKKYISDYTYEGGYETIEEIVSQGKIPEAIFVANDIMALGVIDALKKHQISVPDEVKVVGFDNIEMSAWPSYSLTTWEQPINEMVKRTVDYLTAEINEYSGFTKNIEIDGRLIVRNSTYNS